MLAGVVAVLIGGQGMCGESTVSLESLLHEMVDRDSLAQWPEPAFVCMHASSYNRLSKSPGDVTGWFANSDKSHFIRMEENQGRREGVMMDADGPGSVVRFWTGGKPAEGIVRFYLGGGDVPVITAQLQDLLSGRAFVQHPLALENPKQAGNLYLPIPYAGHCKITYEEADPKNLAGPPPQRWYNIEYRSYPAGTKVKSFTMRALKSDEALVRKTEAALLGEARSEVDGQFAEMNEVIEPGKEAIIDLPSGPTAVRSLAMLLDGFDAQELRSLVLIGNFDDERTIWCPVGDFFGSGVGVNLLESCHRAVTKEGSMTCRWVMPYKKSARFSLRNLGQNAVKGQLTVITSPWKWDDRSMHFHTGWRHQYPIPTRPHSDWNYLTATGKGVYVGDTLCVFNPMPTWWGEGDEKIWVDGESFPSHFGTGTEDYYCYAWGDLHLFQGPFANQVRCDGQTRPGFTVVTRTRALDAIPFTKSLQFDMEVWHPKACQVGYAATTYWYALPGATSNRGPLPEEATRPISPTPHSPETLK